MTTHVCRRGDTWKSTVTFDVTTLVGSKIWFTVKKRDTDPDPGVLQLVSDGIAPGIAIDDATHATFTIAAASSALLPVGRWHFDVQIKLPSGEVYTTDSGTFQVLADYTLSTT